MSDLNLFATIVYIFGAIFVGFGVGLLVSEGAGFVTFGILLLALATLFALASAEIK